MKQFKIKNKKLLIYKSEGDVRLKVGESKSMVFRTLIVAVENYLAAYKLLSNTLLFDVEQAEFNKTVKILLCGYPISIELAFEIYEAIRVEYNLNIPKHTELKYGKKSILFSPSNIG